MENEIVFSASRGHYSGFASRAMAYLIDAFIIGITASLAGWLVREVLLQVLRVDISSCPPYDLQLAVIACFAVRWMLAAFVVSLAPLYLILFWILIGKTPGKAMLGLRVRRLDGQRLTLLTAVIRLAGYALCFLSLGLGFLWVLIDDRRQGWHDKLARTCVVYEWDARQNERLLARVDKRLTQRRIEGEAQGSATTRDGVQSSGSRR